MMWGYYDGRSWLWMTGMMVLFWGSAIALVIWTVRAFTGRGWTTDQAMETLRRRPAAREIGQRDFESAKNVLPR